MKQNLVNRIISDKWRVLQHVGSGGVGSVFEGRHTTTDKRCAIKILHAEHEIREGIIERFYQEILILRRLRHPGIVEVFEFGFEEDLGFYLVMEYLEGCSLSDMLKKLYGDVPLEWIYRWFNLVCDAMSYSHQKEVVHRDLKPDHVFFVGGPERDDNIKIIDFGIAKFTMGENPNLTQSGTTLGTPRYLSPEQAMGKEIDHRADIYALSVILFELLTRQSLFRAESSLQYMMHHAYTEPPTLSMVRQDRNFPEELEKLVADGLAKDPNERPESMAVFKERLFNGMKDMLRTEELSVLTDTQEPAGDSSMYRISKQTQTPSPSSRKIKIGGTTEAPPPESDNVLDQLAHELANEPLPERKKAKMRAAKLSGQTKSLQKFITSPESRRYVFVIVGALCLLLLGTFFGVMLGGRGSNVEKPRVPSNRTSTRAIPPGRRLVSVEAEAVLADAGENDDDEDDEAVEEAVFQDGGPAEKDAKKPKSKEDWLKVIQSKLNKQKKDKARVERLLREIREKQKAKENVTPDQDPKGTQKGKQLTPAKKPRDKKQNPKKKSTDK
ncbi:MAG: serine/threonine protein kinase [Deltaproteobacteria bacterium]|nr:MAG: serine/threonine protein kinase [Deltaproteobacteria bacterium]